MPAKRYFLLGFILLILLGGCVTELPTAAPPPEATTSPDVTVSPGATPALPENTPIPAPSATPPEEAPASPPAPAPASPAPPEATATPPPPPDSPTPGPEAARDLVLDYLRGGYRLNLPANAAFAPAALSLDVAGVDVIAAYSSGPFQVFVGRAQLAGARLLTPVNVRNTQSQANWWGDVYPDGLIVTTVAAGLPAPRSQRVGDWVGLVVKLPPGSPFDDYFEGGQGNGHGIASNNAGVAAVLDRLAAYEGRVKIWGELRYGVDDYNARRLLINRIELLDGELPDTTTVDEATQEEDPPDPDVGPTGALRDPLPGAVLSDSVWVRGDAENLFENSVLVQVEDASGVVLGKQPAITDAPEMGQRGRFEAAVDFANPAAAGAGRVALYSENPANGELTLLAWVNVRLAGAGHGGQAQILRPQPQTPIRSAVVVGGTTIGVVGDVVLVRVEDLAGSVWGQAQAKILAGGEWEVRVTFRNPPTPRSGRITVYEVGDRGVPVTVLATIPVELAR